MLMKTALKKRKKHTLLGFLWVVAVIALLVACVATIVSTQTELIQKREELVQMQAEYDELNAENGELTRLLTGDDLSEYMELLATQQLNYSYPNERRFYDTTRN